MRSVHGDPAYADTLEEMMHLYRELRERYEVPSEYGPGSV